jgi:Tol biopolymer transport system component
MIIDGAFSKIWLLDIARGTFTRASQLPGDQDRAEWMPDSIHVTFGADTSGTGDIRLFTDSVDGSGEPAPLLDVPEPASPLEWSPDGQSLLYLRIAGATAQDVWVFSAADKKRRPFLRSAANEWAATFSPDGHWVAYVSDESGRPEIYVRPFSGPGSKSQVSIDGGTAPVWSRDGREMFFAKGDTLFAAPVQFTPTFSSGAPKRLLSGPFSFDAYTVNYDVTPDGQQFLVPRSPLDAAPRQLELVLNWFEEVKRLAP